jgi:hypothetical protein
MIFSTLLHSEIAAFDVIVSGSCDTQGGGIMDIDIATALVTVLVSVLRNIQVYCDF